MFSDESVNKCTITCRGLYCNCFDSEELLHALWDGGLSGADVTDHRLGCRASGTVVPDAGGEETSPYF